MTSVCLKAVLRRGPASTVLLFLGTLFIIYHTTFSLGKAQRRLRSENPSEPHVHPSCSGFSFPDSPQSNAALSPLTGEEVVSTGPLSSSFLALPSPLSFTYFIFR